MKSQDDTLTELLDNLRIEIGRRNQTEINDGGLIKIILDFPEKIDKSISDKFRTYIIRNTTESWDEKFGRLLAFRDSHGHASPELKEPEIGVWVNTQRSNFSSGKIRPDRVKKLESIESGYGTQERNGGIKNIDF